MIDARSRGSEEFPRTAGRWCLDFVATLGRRHRSEPLERLPDNAAAARWLAGAALPSPPDLDDGDLVSLRELREALHRLVRAHMRGGPVDAGDLDALNRAARAPDLAPQIDATGTRRLVPAVTTAAVASTLARDGIDLLATIPAARIKECEHPDCSLLFLDHTQGNRRRWCSMQRCGNQIKVADYRERRSRHDPGTTSGRQD